MFLDFFTNVDERGSLISLHENEEIPFEIKRIYYIYGNHLNLSRGYHAHVNLEQIAIAVNGSCNLMLDDGISKKIYKLDSPNKGVYIGKMHWREMYDFSKDCVLLVIASNNYDKNDYISDYENFLERVRQINAK